MITWVCWKKTCPHVYGFRLLGRKHVAKTTPDPLSPAFSDRYERDSCLPPWACHHPRASSISLKEHFCVVVCLWKTSQPCVIPSYHSLLGEKNTSYCKTWNKNIRHTFLLTKAFVVRKAAAADDQPHTEEREETGNILGSIRWLWMSLTGYIVTLNIKMEY